MSGSIPEDLYLPILLRLPVKSTFVCKCVCKTWLSLISDPRFSKMHLDLTSQRNISGNLMVAGLDMFDNSCIINSISHESLQPSLWDWENMSYPFQSLGYSVEILGSSNGLICLMLVNYVEMEFFVCLWNPATREYKKITEPTDEIDFLDILIHAFGYDHKSDDYKLVIGVGSIEEASTAVYVYSLESDLWKSVISVPYYFCSSRESGVLVNGDFHFLAERGDGSRLIVSLDIVEERFKEIELSVELKENGHWIITEAVFQGCLGVLHVFRPDSVADDNGPGHVELWVMQAYGVQNSWTKRYTITHEIITRKILGGSFSLRFISSSKNGEILLLMKGKLILYDPKDGSVIEGDIGCVEIPGSEAKYFESLVSVNSGTYVKEGQIEDSLDSESIDSEEA